MKKTANKKKDLIDYILKVDLDELGISEDEFDDLQSLFQLFDHDRDGILNLREVQKLIRCLGFSASEEEARGLASLVSVDSLSFSVSFNEYLRLISIQRKSEPSEDTLLHVFQTFDPLNTGQIEEDTFRRIMRSKEAVIDEEVNEMLEEYRKLQIVKEGDESSGTDSGSESVILYREFISMLQQ